MTTSQPSKGYSRLAIAEVILALVTVIFGALTTSKNAGMAFADWPTSDGHNMILYPWLQDFARNWDKFLEHGHRLAGALIGLWSILLVVMAYVWKQRPAVKALAIAILFCVICQGLLGGFRVELNSRGLAMLHGIFAAMVFSLMGCLVAITNPLWNQTTGWDDSKSIRSLKWFGLGCVVLIEVQYLYGSLVRHQGSGLREHLWLGLSVPVIILIYFLLARRSSNRWLSRSARFLFVVVLLQVALGLFTWVMKYGYAQMGYVPVADSIEQVMTRTFHMVLGAIVLTAVVVNAVKVIRVHNYLKTLPRPDSSMSGGRKMAELKTGEQV